MPYCLNLFRKYKIIEIAKENGLQLNVTIRHQPTTLLGTIIILVRVFFTFYMHICADIS